MTKKKNWLLAAIFTVCGATTVGFGLTSCLSNEDTPIVVSTPDCGFIDIANVFNEVEDDETVVFVLRHAERGFDYSPNGLLTENGKAQARMVGEKIKSDEAAFYAHSDYKRTKQTCKYIAIGRGEELEDRDEQWDILHGEYFMKDANKIKSNNLYSWEAASRWAYEGVYVDKGYYDLDQRAGEWMDSLMMRLPNMKRINVLVSHDYVVSALTIYASNRMIDLRYWFNKKWINYLAGIAIIIDPERNIRFKTVCGLDTGYMIK